MGRRGRRVATHPPDRADSGPGSRAHPWYCNRPMPPSRASGVRLESLLSQLREPVFLVDPERRIVYANRAWEALTGYPAADTLPLPCGSDGRARPGDLDGLGASFAPPPEALAGRPSATVTLILGRDGERLWRRLDYLPFRDEPGRAWLLGIVRTTESPALGPDSQARRLHVELIELRERFRQRPGHEALVGRGPGFGRLLDQVAAASATAVPVLLVGEPGTGKRAVARAIHQGGSRRQAPLLGFDCQALPPELLLRELFGGEDSGTPRLAPPDGSTLVLGDVLDLPRDLQERLVAALDGRVRLIATTAGDPEAALRGERLRPGTYYALTALVIQLEPLRRRLDELPLLAQHFLERANARGARRRDGFAAETLEVLSSYDWPGNLRELGRVVDAAHGRGEDDLVRPEDLPAAIRGNLGAAFTPPPPPPSEPLDALLTRVERRIIELALRRSRQNKSRAADLLGISRPRLYRRIKELELPDEPEPADEPHDGG